jgi:surface antigen
MIIRFAGILAVGLLVSGCMSSPSTGGSALIGAFAGPLGTAGAQPMSAGIAEAMAGGLIGRTLGEDLDRGDRQRALEAEYRALEYTASGESVTWQGDGRLSGQVMAAPPYRVGSQNCRQYTHTVSQNGVERVGRGTACRNEDGSWTPLV